MPLDTTLEACLQITKRQYFQLTDPNLIRLPAPNALKAPDVQTWLYDQLLDGEKVQYLPPPRYQLRFLKRVVRLIEQAIIDPEEDETSDDLMSTLASLISSNLPSEADAAQEKAFVTYSFPTSDSSVSSIDNSVTLLESRAVISGSGTTGLRTWEAALHLGSFLTTQEGQAFVRDKTMMELGAGTGLVSIMCAKHLGAKRVVATDGVEIIVDAIRDNLFLNGLDDSRQIEAAALKWGFRSLMESIEEDYAVDELDVVVGADVTYDKSVIPALVATIGRLFDARPTMQVLIAATIRNEATFEAFRTACRKRRFKVDEIDFSPRSPEHQNGPFYSTAVALQILHILPPSAEDHSI